ncbi:MAG: Gfo/Idh/MocA family oxidoreductase [Alphaproteobacteria bacterium]|nr:Gfo/Idh/MocA family oxidoreductase [Alphaproteobacteria bacterium]
MRKPLRLGMVGGLSNVGETHRAAARMDGLYSLDAAVLSRDRDKNRRACEDLGIAEDRRYSDFAAMAAAEANREDGVEVVAVITPNNTHAPIAAAFLETGVHVLCEKPMTTSYEDALGLVRLAREKNLFLALCHAYAFYPMVHEARRIVAAGELGALRTIQVEYPSGWGASLVETSKSGAAWRMDPAQSGASSVVGDLGTHAHHLACFVSGLQTRALLAELSTTVKGRGADDNAQLLLRFDGGVGGALWTTMAAAGCANALRLRVFGERGHLAWSQETPEELFFRGGSGADRVYRRAMEGMSAEAAAYSRSRPGQPQGFAESFANLYRALARAIHGRADGAAPPWFPDGVDGARGVDLVEAARRSHDGGGVWVALRDVEADLAARD